MGPAPESFVVGQPSSYTATYLHEEILTEALTRQVQGFSRFLQIAAQNSGQFLDISKLATKAKVNRSAPRKYFEILEDTLTCDRVDAFESDKFNLVKHPKYFFFDIGVVNGVLGNFTVSADRKGLLMEHLFFNQLKNASYCLDQSIRVSHLRTRNGLEVDFVVELAGRIFLIEVKSSTPSATELTPLTRVRKLFLNSTEAFVACAQSEEKNQWHPRTCLARGDPNHFWTVILTKTPLSLHCELWARFSNFLTRPER